MTVVAYMGYRQRRDVIDMQGLFPGPPGVARNGLCSHVVKHLPNLNTAAFVSSLHHSTKRQTQVELARARAIMSLRLYKLSLSCFKPGTGTAVVGRALVLELADVLSIFRI